jgi:hypothetical protein
MIGRQTRLYGEASEGRSTVQSHDGTDAHKQQHRRRQSSGYGYARQQCKRLDVFLPFDYLPKHLFVTDRGIQLRCVS